MRWARSASRTLFLFVFSILAPLTAVGADSLSSSRTSTAALLDGSPLGPEGLPVVLTARDATLYRDIFALQEAGDMAAADQRIAQLGNRLLLGHVLAQRYLHPTAHRSTFEELSDWLAHYADHPDAERIYKLALRRLPQGAAAPPEPALPSTGVPAAADGRAQPYRPSQERDQATGERVRAIKSVVLQNVAAQRFTATLELLESDEVVALFDPAELDWGYARVANGLYLYGDHAKALVLAEQAAARSGTQMPSSHWIAGLAAWRLGELAQAAEHFEKLARAERTSSWMAAAGAYWAGRAHRELGHTGHTIRWFMTAAEYPRTFYGLLAHRSLGMKLPFDFRSPRLSKGLIGRLVATPQSRRMLALMQIDQQALAEHEMILLARSRDPELAAALLALAEEAGIPSLSYRLANRLIGDSRVSERGGLEAGLYPLPPWAPKEGFQVDRALVYAFMRYESQFNPEAASKQGALGLMQLMPQTAAFIAKRKFDNGQEGKLLDPELNTDIGQRYLAHLLGHKGIDGDLFHLAAAYNGGPGNLDKWKRRMGEEEDPLLFIESLPSAETRIFIERVLTNFWIYRARLGQPTPELDALASGAWPQYIALDALTRDVAKHAKN
ncbi:MAG: transglycosylase SLT domain-containing protein [Kiloniellales bacterium]